MFKKLGISGAVAVTALGLMQTSAFAAEHNDGRDGGHRVVVQNDRTVRDDYRDVQNRDRDARRAYDRGDRFQFHDRDDRFQFQDRDDYRYGYGDQFWFRFGFGGDRDHDRDGR